MAEMHFFHEYFGNSDNASHTSITVFCDIGTFKWLLQYMNANEACLLDGNNVLSILVSSEFLQMPTLASRCIDFFCSRIDEITGVIANIDCIQPQTWDKYVDII